MSTKRNRRATPQQFEAMIKFMRAHPHLINGKLSSILPSTKRLRLWEELASILNDDAYGPSKTTHQWRRAWIDLKSEVKEKIAEQERRRRNGIKEQILNPCHREVAHLLTKVAVDVELAENHAQFQDPIMKEVENRRRFQVKDENSIHLDSDYDNSTPTPFVMSLISLNEAQERQNNSSHNVKNENSFSINEESSNSDAMPEPSEETLNVENDVPKLDFSTLSNKSSCITAKSLQPKRKRHRKMEAEENEHLNNLVLVEKEKTEMLSLIAHALSTTNENEEKQLKIEEERNKLIQERNAIENERNELFKAFLEHIVAKDTL